MTESLDKHLEAYQGNSDYEFDNQLQLKWYPKRVVDSCQGLSSLLELGVGYGYTTNQFNKYFKRHVVVDASAEIIGRFYTEFPDVNCEIHQAYFESFETEERFDVVTFGFVLEHVDDPVLVMSRFRKFLTPGGRMFAAVPNAESLNRRLGHHAGMLPDMKKLSEHDHLLGHKRYYTVDTFRDDIEAAGCSIAKMEGIFLKPFMTRQILELNLDPRLIDALCEVAIPYPELSCGILAEIAVN